MNTPTLHRAIRDARGLNTQQKCILMMLVTRGNDAFPSYETLMGDTGIGNRRTLKKALDELIQMGWLSVTKSHRNKGKWATNRYVVSVPRKVQDEVSGVDTTEYVYSEDGQRRWEANLLGRKQKERYDAEHQVAVMPLT